MAAKPPAPIPQRMPPLTWRRPAFIWTPIALALSIGWPAAATYNDAGLQRLTLVAGASVFAVALVTLGVSWAIGRAPRTRRTVVMHVVLAGALAALSAPYVLTWLLATVADYNSAGSGENFPLSMSIAMTPLALVLGLPIALVSGIVFAWTALIPPQRKPAAPISRHDVQPFQ